MGELTVTRDVPMPEALPGLIPGFTATLVLPIGDLAIRDIDRRFTTPVMVAVIVVLVALVALIQAAGDAGARRADHR